MMTARGYRGWICLTMLVGRVALACSSSAAPPPEELECLLPSGLGYYGYAWREADGTWVEDLGHEDCPQGALCAVGDLRGRCEP